MTQKKYIVYFLVKIMQKTSDRRTQLRVPVQIPVSLRCREEPDARTAILEDLSWGGALCWIDVPLPVDDRSLLLQLPWKSGETVNIETKVLRAYPKRPVARQVMIPSARWTMAK